MGQTPRVIKAGQASGLRPADFNSVDSLEELTRRVESAKAEIEAFRQKAVAEVQASKLEAQRQGLEAGYREGLARAQQEASQRHRQELEKEITERLTSLTQAIGSLCGELTAARDQWLAEWEKMGLDLACRVADRMVHAVVAKPNEIAVKSLGEVLRLVGKCPKATVRLHPDDAATLDLASPSWSAATQAIGQVNVVADPTLSRGDCKLDSEFGRIDASLSTQLDRIRAELMGETDIVAGS